MKRILLIAILIISFFIQACYGRWEKADISFFNPGPGDYEINYQNNYQLGVKKSAFIGQDLINVKAYAVFNKTIQEGIILNSQECHYRLYL